MKIVVCVKHVPDLQADRRFTAAGRVEREDVDSTLNELDENAVELALTLVEEHGGEVVALTVGPSGAQDAVRKALQMGASDAVHVLDDAVAGSDVYGTAAVLAAAVRRLGADTPVDLVVTGMAALDGLTSMLPVALAAELGVPALTLAAGAEVADGAVTVRRELDTAVEVIRAPLPALISVTDQANEPRYPSFAGIMAARKKAVTTLTLADLGVDPSTVGPAAARTEVLDAQPRPPRTDRVLVTDDGGAGAQLAAWLVDHKLV